MSASRASSLALLARTAVHVQPAQAAHRARLRTQAAALRRWPTAGRRLLAGPDPATAVGWPTRFVPVDAQAPERWPGLPELSADRLRLLGMPTCLGDPPDWQQDSAPVLWRHHLHYWDWAFGLAAERDLVSAQRVFARLWRSWRAAVPYGQGEAWLPYPTATRAWSWCGLYHGLVAGSDIERSFRAELAAHTGFLRRHLESDIGGNHLLRELKTLAGLAVFFADERLLCQALTRLAQQVAVQILPDGGHYERAPAYHCLVLADLIDAADLLRAAGRPEIPTISAAISQMRRWLGTVLSPTGEVPPLGDGYPVDRGLLRTLRPDPVPAAPVRLLPDSGLVVAALGGWHLLADIGRPGPDQLPAHAHAGTLGCLVHVDRAPLLVDTATSTYEPGPVRDHERSTAAHNTVEVDASNSTEVWGAFRAARRARVYRVATRCDATEMTVEGAHDGFRRLPGRPVHQRRWKLTPAGLTVQDLVTGFGRHAVAVHWHLAPGATAKPGRGRAVVTTPAGSFEMKIASTTAGTLTTGSQPVATGFLRTTQAPVLSWRTSAELPVLVTTTWQRAVAGSGSPS